MSAVLDSWAVLAWLRGERPAADDVAELLDRAARGEVEARICLLNLGEVHYIVARRHGDARADEIRARWQVGPVGVVSVDDDLVWSAAVLKARFAIAYADAFAAALALRHGAELWTGDPELRAVETGAGLRVHWLSRAP